MMEQIPWVLLGCIIGVLVTTVTWLRTVSRLHDRIDAANRTIEELKRTRDAKGHRVNELESGMRKLLGGDSVPYWTVTGATVTGVQT